MKIRQVGTELFQGDRRTDRHDDPNSRSNNFSNAPKMYKAKPHTHVNETQSQPSASL
jgi:hypothetical protein